MNSSLSRRALVSVSDKTGLAELVAGLIELGYEIVSTGGTRKFLEEQRVRVVDVSAYTGFPEIMEGRVKTLHPKVHGAILGRPDLAGDAAAIREHGIIPFQVVVCNLYPFEQTVAKSGVTFDEAIEQIDVGGPSMIRAAAKNHAYVTIVTDPRQYQAVLAQLRAGGPSLDERLALALAAFERTAAYDRAIADFLGRQTSPAESSEAVPFPSELTLSLSRVSVLRYGENPHQQGAFYVSPHAHASTLARADVLQGKELSYNNLLDLETALSIAREFSEPAAVVIKHNNPCGCAVATTTADAFRKAHAGDPVSAFGSIVGFNRAVDLATAELIVGPDQFVEAIIAPEYAPDALEKLASGAKWSKSLRLLRLPGLLESRPRSWEYRGVSGGMLVQDRDDVDPAEMNAASWKVVTEREPTAQEWTDLEFAWVVAKHVKSNAIVFARSGAVAGVGAGQMSRVDSVQLAAAKAGDRAGGAVVGSDAFFPFRDGVDAAAKAGITAIAQPGGSRRDDEVIAACNEHKIAMVFTGRRHFRH